MSSDVSKCDQVVFECMQKVAEVIISSRVSLHQKQRRDREINSKFSLHVEELAFVRHSMEAWKDDLHMPLGIDVFWQEHSEQSERLGLGDAPPSVELLERWDIVYEAQDGVETKSAQLRHLYKRAIILLRTLYAFVRMIPAYQVHERIQKAYDSRDRALVDTRDDMGFCLYPILDLSRGGLGLEFSGAGSGEKDETRVNTHVGQGGQTASTDSYSFKPLEAPHGKIKIKVTYRRGVDSKAYQHGQTVKKQTSSLAPNMTTSIIQDYVPHDYEHTSSLHNEHEGESPAPSPAPAAPTVTAVAAVSGGETTHEQWPRLATMQEDGAMAAGSVTDGCSSSRVAGMARLERQQFSSYATGGLEVVRPSDLGAAIDAHSPIDSQQQQQHRGDGDGTVDEANLGQGPDVLHWPSPEQGHGYAHNKRVNKLLGQGPAPFLTPGPHRHKLVPGGRQGPDVNMEPLDLGPKADVDARDPCVQAAAGLQPSGHGGNGCITHNNVEAFARSVGRRNSDRHCSAEYVANCSPDKFCSLEPHGSLEGHVDRKEEALPEPHLPGFHVQDKHLRDGILGQRGLMARALGEEEEEGADSPARRFYRRNSICEAPSATPVPREQSLMSVHGNRSTAGHGPDTYAQRPPALTPPFSYCEEFSSARPAGVEADGSPFRLGQPLVSFSPPFEAPCVDPRGHGGALGEGISGVGMGESPSLDPDAKLHHGSEVTCTVPRASLGLLGTASGSPALLETLPESPFSWKGRRPENTQPPMVVDKATPARRPASQSSPITPGRLAHAVPNKAAGTDTSEGLPFAVEMLDERIETFAQDPSVFGVDDGMGVAASLPPTSLFALCSAASSKSDLLMQNSQPMASTEQPAQALGFSPERGDADADAADWEGVSRATATSYANAGDLYGEEEVGKTVRSLEEELDGFRQFHLELERQRS